MRYESIAIFQIHEEPSRGPLTLVASALVHSLGAFVLLTTFSQPPHLVTLALNDKKYEMRHLDLQATEFKQKQQPVKKESGQKARLPKAPKQASQGQQAKQSWASNFQDAIQAPQTLVQPDLPSHMQLEQELAVQNVLLWSPPQRKVRIISSPKPNPPSTEAPPSLTTPNAEELIAERALASSEFITRPQPIQATTTAPVTSHTPQKNDTPIAVSEKAVANPTPTAVLSIAKLHIREEKTTLPPVNEINTKELEDVLQEGKDGKVAEAKNEDDKGKADKGEGAGSATDKNKETSTVAGAPDGKENAKVEAETGTGKGSNDQDQQGTPSTRIELPKDGRFGSVISGASLRDQFPEIGEVWSGRMAYTVYLHLGTARNWILQYSLPRNADAATSGQGARVDAPWPFSIVRPNIAPGAINADALMVHGYVNPDGRFEQLAVAFPPQYPQAQYVLAALQQWQFRPATQSGQSARVEVVLIIPEIED